ncbi:MAG: hypothetical protein D6733_04875, partial [Methanobacteriota archaeon]
MKRTNILLAMLLFMGFLTLAGGSAYSRQTEPSQTTSAQSPTSKLGPELQRLLDSGAGGAVSVNIVLVDQPLHDVSKAVKEKHEKELEVSESRIKSIVERARKGEAAGKKAMTLSVEDERKKDLYGALTTAEKDEIEREKEKLKQVKRQVVKETIDATRGLIKPGQDRVRRAVEKAGGTVTYEGSFVNIVSATVPVDALPAIAALPDVAFIEKSKVYHALLDTATGSVYAQTFWNAGYNGSPYAVAVVDTGVDSSHPALASRVIDNKTFVTTGADAATSDDLYGHGTHVAGIVASTDATYRGVAPGAWIINAKAGNSSGSLEDSWVMSAIDWAIYNATGGADVVSASFGSPGSDLAFEKFFDALVDDLGIFAAVAAGNSGPGSQTIETPGKTYNVMTVGAMDDQDTTTRSDDSIAWYSSRGPLPFGSDRIKPDIMAPGGDSGADPIVSTAYNWEGGNPDFIGMSGTSMATPMVSGAAALLMSAGVTNPLEIKALLINTAEDRGATGPDNDYGWGYMDLNHTFYHTSDVRLGEVNNTVKKLYYVGPALPGDKATLVWNRYSAYNGPNYPTSYNSFASDLDLYLYSESNGTELDNSTLGYSNVEQVVSPSNDTVVIKIDAFSLQRSPETFALATEEGFTETALPEINATISQLNTSYVNNSFQIAVKASNNGSIAIHNVNVTLSLPAGVSLAGGSNPVELGTITAGNTKTATFTLTASSEGNKTINATANSSSYGETITTTSSIDITVYSGPTQISSCTAISSPGVYVLNRSIINSSASTCITITASNVVFDGAGHRIDGQDLGSPTYQKGVYVHNSTATLTNVTVKNLVVTDWWHGIYYQNAQNGNIINNTASSNYNGLYLSSSSNNNLTGNNASSNTGNGIHLSSSSGNNLINNTAQENNNYDVSFAPASTAHCSNVITNNTGSGNRPIKYFNGPVNLENETLSELILCDADGSKLNNITVIGSATKANNGLMAFFTDNSNITNTTADSDRIGIYLYTSHNNIIINSRANSNGDSGIRLSYSSNNILTDNTANSNSYHGIYLSSSSGNNLTNNRADSNSYRGIYLESSGNNNIINNSASSNNGTGIYLSSSSGNNIYNNLFNNTNNFGNGSALGTNSWNTTLTLGTNIVGGPYIGGNYWAKPDGTGFSETC